ncbi:MAG: DUF4258 domain-containing protein [Candidatus Cloacimonetes bacterium]|nr:DUF4258 domain-containing protein [Candidatus Cloacimonadota bacterium]
MNYEITFHCQARMKERSIELEWVMDAVLNPDTTKLSFDGRIHHYKRIAAFDNRWLHVIVDPKEKPGKLLTAYFDRGVSTGDKS